MKKSRTFQLTRGETEALLCLLYHAGVSSSFPDPDEKARMREVYANLPIAARSRIVSGLNEKIWNAWADTHPEEGPFK